MTAFIFEQPDQPISRKHHPHLIVACDRCRRKKIKCQIVHGQRACNSCLDTGFDCTFRDRQTSLYHQDKDQGSNAPVLRRKLPATRGARTRAASRSLSSEASTTGSTRTTPITGAPGGNPVEARSAGDSSSDASAGLAYTSSWIYPAGAVQQELPPYPGLRILDQGPDPALMPYFIDVFFRCYGRAFRFLNYERTVSDFWQSALQQQLANLIALLALRHADDILDLYGLDAQAAEAAYSEQAKVHISLQWDRPSVAMIQALVLISHYETSKENLDAAGAYQRRAFEMAVSLHLDNDANLSRMTDDEDERKRLRQLWHAVRAHGDPLMTSFQ